MPKKITSHRDLNIRWGDSKDAFVLDARSIGAGRPCYRTKTMARTASAELFDRWQRGAGADDNAEAAPNRLDLTVEHLFQRFLNHSRKRLADPDAKYGPGSFRNLENDLKCVGRLKVNGLRFPKMRLETVTHEIIEDYIWPGIRRSVGPRTAIDQLQHVSRAFTFGVRKGVIPSNPFDRAEIEKPDMDAHKREVILSKLAKVNFETLQKITAACPEKHRLKIIFAARSGLRVQEIVALKVFNLNRPLEGRIDFDGRMVYVRQALK